MDVNFFYLLEKFFEYNVLRGDSRIIYKKIIHYFTDFNSDITPENLSVDDVLKWRKIILTQIRPVSWNTYARHLHALMNFGIKQKILTRADNPFSKVQIKYDNKSIKHLNSFQMQKIDYFLIDCHQRRKLKFIKPIWFFVALVKTFQYTGMRKKQLLKLRVQDINLDEDVIYIDGLHNKNHVSHLIPISSKLKPYLLDLIMQHKEINSTDFDQLFNINCFRCHESKTRKMSVYQIDAIFRNLSYQMDFKVSPHRFRHTVATTILKNSNNIYMAQKILGHQSIRTTMQYIGHDIELLRDGIELI
ncbi:site-specific integrase [Acinetobacter sp. I-MWF]|uniref:tyrosine-type recombinase/integrase n=1 Tax=Acinetobacter sp. I-MWF TaxID=2940517 RepID=UPI0021C6D09F|nr:site-specific integrase [Acinetobacter sp. I-MWF]MCT9976771.1 site-specific integrase [Acinetobacter sp. I-MWF]